MDSGPQYTAWYLESFIDEIGNMLQLISQERTFWAGHSTVIKPQLKIRPHETRNNGQYHLNDKGFYYYNIKKKSRKQPNLNLWHKAK